MLGWLATPTAMTPLQGILGAAAAKKLKEAHGVTTVGGLLTKEIGRVPIEGSEAVIAGLSVRALPGQGRRHRITHVVVTETQEAVTP